MPRKYRFLSRGFIDIFSLVAVVFLITTAITGVVVVNKQNANFDIRNKAAGTCDKNLVLNTAGTCPDGKTIKHVHWADNCVDMVTDTCTEAQNKPSCAVGTIMDTAGTCPDGKTKIYKRLNADCVTTTTDICPNSAITEDAQTPNQPAETVAPPETLVDDTTSIPDTTSNSNSQQLTCIDPCTADSNCGDGYYCYKPATGCPVCKPKATLCTPGQKQCSGNYLQVCNSQGINWLSDNCGSPGCNPTTLTCNPEPVSPPVSPTTTTQTTVQPSSCSPSGTVASCETLNCCEKTTKVTGMYGYCSCHATSTIPYKVGDTQCNGSNLETWDGGKWNAKYCENGCANGSCNKPKLKADGSLCNANEECASGYCYDNSTMTIGSGDGIPNFSLARCQPYSFDTHIAATKQANATASKVAVTGLALEFGAVALIQAAPAVWSLAGGSVAQVPLAAYSYGTAAIATSPVLQTGLAIATLSQGPATVSVCEKYGAFSSECILTVGGVTSGYFIDPLGSEQALQTSYQQLQTTAQEGFVNFLSKFVRNSPPIDLPELDVPGVIDLTPNADRTRWSLPTDTRIINDSFSSIDSTGARFATPQELDFINPSQIVPYEAAPLAPIVTASDPVFAISLRSTQITESPININNALSSPIDVALNLLPQPSRSNLPLALDIEPYNLTSSPDFPNLLAEAPTIVRMPEVALEIPNTPALTTITPPETPTELANATKVVTSPPTDPYEAVAPQPTRTWIEGLPAKTITAQGGGEGTNVGTVLTNYASHWDGIWDSGTSELTLTPKLTQNTSVHGDEYIDINLAIYKDGVVTPRTDTGYTPLGSHNSNQYTSGLVVIPENVKIPVEAGGNKLIFRGINYEGMEAMLKDNQLSSGSVVANIPRESGQIFFTPDPTTAFEYAANRFYFDMATFEKPSYVVVIRWPDGVPVTNGEMGLNGPIPLDEIVKIYEVRPYAILGGKIPLTLSNDGSYMVLPNTLITAETAPKAQFVFKETSLNNLENTPVANDLAIPANANDIPTPENVVTSNVDANIPTIQETTSQPSFFQRTRTTLFGEPSVVNTADLGFDETIRLYPGDKVSGVTPSLGTESVVPDLSPTTRYYWSTSSDSNIHELTSEGIPVKLQGATAIYIDTTPSMQRGATPYEVVITKEKNVAVTIERANPEPGIFTIRDTEGNWFPGIKKLVDSTGVISPENNVNNSKIVQDNAKLILNPADNREFVRILMDESIGGNAGDGYSAVNAAIDGDGKIVALGNIQDLTPKMRNGLNNGELQRISIQVKAYPQIEGPNYRISYDTNSIPQDIQNSLAKLETQLNQPITKPSLFGLEWNGFINTQGQIQWPIGRINTP